MWQTNNKQKLSVNKFSRLQLQNGFAMQWAEENNKDYSITFDAIKDNKTNHS